MNKAEKRYWRAYYQRMSGEERANRLRDLLARLQREFPDEIKRELPVILRRAQIRRVK
jgi:hypothetical protein